MDEYGPYADAWQPDNETAIRFACIRVMDGTHDTTSDPDFIYNDGLYLHTNDAHIAVGVTEVKIDKATGWIRVVTPDNHNGTVLVTGDETAASHGLLFGGSNGGSHVNILCYQIGVGVLDLRDEAVYNAMAGGNLNLWLAWLSPLVRGTGQPSKADQALTAIADLQARVAALEAA